MRLTERTLTVITVHPRQITTGNMGSRTRSYAAVGARVRASVLPGGGNVKTLTRGDVAKAELRLLVPAGTQVAPGDGVRVNNRMYAVSAVNRWTAHLEILCEAVACGG